MARGDLVFSKVPLCFTNKQGKKVAQHIVGVDSGYNSRIIVDCFSGFVECGASQLVSLSDAYKVTISCLGAGIVTTYVPAASKKQALELANKIIQGKAKDIVGRTFENLGWVRGLAGLKDISPVVLGVAHACGKPEPKEEAPKVEKEVSAVKRGKRVDISIIDELEGIHF